jgi:hypothetical protein
MIVILQLTDEIFHSMPPDTPMNDDYKYIMDIKENDIIKLIQNHEFITGNPMAIYEILKKWTELCNENLKLNHEIEINSNNVCIIDLKSKNIIIIEKDHRINTLQDLWIKTVDSYTIERSYIDKFFKGTNNDWDRIIDLFIHNHVIGVLKNEESYNSKKWKNPVYLFEYLEDQMFGIIKNKYETKKINRRQFKKLKKDCFNKKIYKIDFSPFKLKSYYIDDYDELSRLLTKKTVLNEIRKMGIELNEKETKEFLGI